PLSPGRALVVMVTEDGLVENRLIDVPLGTPPSTLVQAGNYLSARLVGRTADEARQLIAAEIESSRAALDELTTKLVQAGLASWCCSSHAGRALNIRGQSKLHENGTALGELARLRALIQSIKT